MSSEGAVATSQQAARPQCSCSATISASASEMDQ